MAARPKFPTLKDGDALTPWHLNVIYRELDRWNKARVAGSLAFQNGPDGPLWVGQGGGDTRTIRFAKLPSGGINAGSSGTVEFYADGRMTTLTGLTATAYNGWSDNANPTSRKCTVQFENGVWSLVDWGCT
jgi:hypothetical protein